MKKSVFLRPGIFVALLLASTFFAASVAAQRNGQDNGQDSGDRAVETARVFYAGSHFFKTVVLDDVAVVFPGPADNTYQDLPGAGPGAGAIAVIAGQGTLVNVRFAAESQCAGGGTDAGWCGVRILVNGIESLPGPNADYAFDSTNNGEDGSASWEGHAMERHICIRNPGGAVTFVPVQVQWRVFSGDGNTTAPSFRLDDWSLTIESAVASCN